MMLNIVILHAKGIGIGSSFSSVFDNVFLLNYETNLINHYMNFFRYINDIVVFNCDNFENISLTIYRKKISIKKYQFY